MYQRETSSPLYDPRLNNNAYWMDDQCGNDNLQDRLNVDKEFREKQSELTAMLNEPEDDSQSLFISHHHQVSSSSPSKTPAEPSIRTKGVEPKTSAAMNTNATPFMPPMAPLPASLQLAQSHSAPGCSPMMSSNFFFDGSYVDEF